MLYQLSYASPKPFQEPIQSADTPLSSAYHGTEIKVSIAAQREQTPNRPGKAPRNSHTPIIPHRLALDFHHRPQIKSFVAQSAVSVDHSLASIRINFTRSSS
jgi:hypothetical protein